MEHVEAEQARSRMRGNAIEYCVGFANGVAAMTGQDPSELTRMKEYQLFSAAQRKYYAEMVIRHPEYAYEAEETAFHEARKARGRFLAKVRLTS